MWDERAGRGSWMWDGNFPRDNTESPCVLATTLIPTNNTSYTPTMAADNIHRASTFAPVNIAVIKYAANSQYHLRLHLHG